jgi:MFS family permease
MSKTASPAESLSPSHTRYAVLLGLCLVTVIGYVHRNSIAVAEKEMRTDLGLTPEQMGLVLSAFFLTYALFQIPTAWLSHVWGTRRALPFFALGSSLTTALLGVGGGLAGLCTARLGQGIAQAGFFPAATSSFRRWFPVTQRGLASGSLGSAMSVGGVIGAALTGILLVSISWRWVFALYALPGLAWAVWFLVWFRNRPEDHPSVNPGELNVIRFATPAAHQKPSRGAGSVRDGTAGAGSVSEGIKPPPGIQPSSPVQVGPPAPSPPEPEEEKPEPTPWVALATSPTLLWICGQQFFRAAGYMFFASWFPTFLRESRGVSLPTSGLLTSLPLMGVVGGTLVGGVVSDWVLNVTGSRRLARQGVAGISLAVCALLIFLAYPVADPWLAVGLISLGSFAAAFAGPCAYASTIDIGGRHVAPVFATMNMSGNLGAMLFPYAVSPFVSHGYWDALLILFAGLYVAAALCWLFPNVDHDLFEPPSSARSE